MDYIDPYDVFLLVVYSCAGALALSGVALALWLVGRLIVGLIAFTGERMADVSKAFAEAKRSHADVNLIHPDALNALLPLSRSAIEHSTSQVLNLVATHQQAKLPLQPVPHTYSPTYAPHLVNRSSIEANGTEAPQLPALTQAPDFWTLYHQDALPERGFLLGYNMETAQPVIAQWAELYSALVGGAPRSGKSTMIRLVLAQAALQGSRFVIVDKHFAAGQDSMGASLLPLRSRMITDIASNEAQMLDTLRLVRSIAVARLTGKDGDKTPLILAVDETTGLLVRSNIASELVGLLGFLAQESAKVGVFAICIGHQWTSKILPTDVRNSFVSALSCHVRRDTARVMSGSNDFAQVAEALRPPGQAVWMNPAGDLIKMTVPNCTGHHIELVAREVNGVYRVDSPAADVTAKSLPLSLPPSLAATVTGSEVGSEPGSENYTSTTLIVDSARAARVRAAIKSGMGKAEILTDVWQVNMKAGGRRVSQASAEYDEIVRALLG